jgi:hypothetical protein
MQAEACGNGQDDGPVAPMVEGANAHMRAIGVPEHDVAGTIRRADRHDQSDEHRKPWAHDQLDADLPAPHVRQREPRCPTQERHTRPPAEKWTVADGAYDHAPAGSTCPQGTLLRREARRHKIGNHLYRRDEAEAAECGPCWRREPCVHTAATRRNHLAVFGEPAPETFSQPMIAQRETPDARASYGQRRAMVAPVFGPIRSPTR